MATSQAEKTGLPVQKSSESAPHADSVRLPRLHRGDRAHFVWIGRQAVTYDMEIKSTDAEGKEFSFTRPQTEVEDVLHSVAGTIIRTFPTLKQLRRNPLEPDTLHFKPDTDLMETFDGEIEFVQPPTMIIRRQDIDDYIVINHRQDEPPAVPSL